MSEPFVTSHPVGIGRAASVVIFLGGWATKVYRMAFFLNVIQGRGACWKGRGLGKAENYCEGS